MNHNGHDMDHDGKVTTKDTAMFHEMMNEDKRRSSGNAHYQFQPSLLEAIVMIACISYIGALFKGTVPANVFTILLGFILAGVFLYFLNDTMVPW